MEEKKKKEILKSLSWAGISTIFAFGDPKIDKDMLTATVTASPLLIARTGIMVFY